MSDFTEFDAFKLAYAPWPLKNETMYQLGEDLAWDIGLKGSGWTLVISEGTPFDLSVPDPLRWLQSPHDRRLLPAAAVHDELLRRGFDAVFAAAEFRRAARARGIGSWRAWALFFAVLGWTSRPTWAGGS